MGVDRVLGQISSNSKNVQNLGVLRRFIIASLFPIYTNFELLLNLANLAHKFLGLDEHFGQVPSNSNNVQNLGVLRGFIRACLFPFYTNL